MVSIKLVKADLLDLNKIDAWDQVIKAPELNKIKVFVKGIVSVLIGIIATGGHTLPKLKTGEILEVH